MGGLVAQGTFVERVTEQAQAEDGDGEGVAGVARVAAGEAGEGVVVVFGAGRQVPEDGVEEDGGGGNCVDGEMELKRDLHREGWKGDMAVGGRGGQTVQCGLVEVDKGVHG